MLLNHNNQQINVNNNRLICFTMNFNINLQLTYK
jgi:hypothetical protein